MSGWGLDELSMQCNSLSPLYFLVIAVPQSVNRDCVSKMHSCHSAWLQYLLDLCEIKIPSSLPRGKSIYLDPCGV